jgi:hypothetical protein
MPSGAGAATATTRAAADDDAIAKHESVHDASWADEAEAVRVREALYAAKSLWWGETRRGGGHDARLSRNDLWPSSSRSFLLLHTQTRLVYTSHAVVQYIVANPATRLGRVTTVYVMFLERETLTVGLRRCATESPAASPGARASASLTCPCETAPRCRASSWRKRGVRTSSTSWWGGCTAAESSRLISSLKAPGEW